VLSFNLGHPVHTGTLRVKKRPLYFCL